MLGPAHDGGWWAAGLRRPEPAAFLGVPTSTSRTGALQHARLRRLGLRVAELPPMRDVDRFDDAQEVAALVPTSRFGGALRRVEVAVAGRAGSGDPTAPRSSGSVSSTASPSGSAGSAPARSGGSAGSVPARSGGSAGSGLPARQPVKPGNPLRPRSRLHDERTAAVLGVALGVCLTVCFFTGLFSHYAQNPPPWFRLPARPAGLYRATQSLHVATGIASIPLLIAKLWVVYPKLFAWPPLRDVAHLFERVSLVPLIGGSLFLVATGLSNVNIWRPWQFGFRPGHYWAAWITIGALVVHAGAKWATTRRVLRRGGAPPQPGELGVAPDGAMTRRGFLGTVLAASGLLTLFTVGQTVAPLRRLALLAPRRPNVGPQGFPVNRTARSVGLDHVDLAAYRLVVDGRVRRRLELTYDELRRLPQHEATLPIACVEGWSTVQRWRGVRVRDLLATAGAPAHAEATAVSLQRSPRLKTADVNRWHAHDRDTLLALDVNGEPLSADHGFPVRLVGPDRPGVLQTKWVGRLVVR